MSSFDTKANEWDKKDVRVNGAKTIADAIKKQILLTPEMEVLDFGAGTGLLGFEIAKDVKQVYGVDTSKKMLEELQKKNSSACFIKTYHQDILQNPIEKEFDGVVSSMTLHHIADLDKFFTTIFQNIKKGGFLALADLEEEDGTFHSDNTGVHHFGFAPQTLLKAAKHAGFHNINIQNINTIQKPHNNFGVFLLTARK